MFRRFRQRRALRVMERNKKLHQQNHSSKQSGSSTTSRPIETIFRSVNSTMTFQDIAAVRTVASSFGGDGEENQSVSSRSPSPIAASPSNNISCTSFAKGILIGAIDTNCQKQECLVVNNINNQVLQPIEEMPPDLTTDINSTTKHHKRSNSYCTGIASSSAKTNLRNVLDDIQNEIFISERMKEDTLVTQIQLAFAKESYNDSLKELQQKDKTIQRQQLDLLMSHKVINYTKSELLSTKMAFQESVSSLVEMKLLLLSLQEQLKNQNDEPTEGEQISIP